MKRVWISFACGMLAVLGPGVAAANGLPPIVVDGPRNVAAEYSIYWRGFRVAGGDVKVALDTPDYKINGRFETKGILRLLVKGVSDGESAGTVDEDWRLTPDYFRTRSVWKGDRYGRDVAFDDAGRGDDAIFIRPEDYEPLEREPVPDALRQGLDPLSLMIHASLRPWVAGPDGRPQVLADGEIFSTFDGQSSWTYDMRCEDEPVQVKKKSRTVYVGPAYLCDIQVEQTGGFPTERAESERRIESTGREPKITIWFARMGDPAIMLPVKLHARLAKRKVKIYLANLENGQGPL
ncbi:MAG: DUF3108 domain-containing protein [Sphingomonadales bacterium]|nr:DUF3108 domain-containing protein [Sphingomonadales bacterium]